MLSLLVCNVDSGLSPRAQNCCIPQPLVAMKHSRSLLALPPISTTISCLSVQTVFTHTPSNTNDDLNALYVAEKHRTLASAKN